MRMSSVLAALVLSGCAASAAQVKEARHTAYQGDYDEVFNATVASLKEEYPIVKVLDREGGKIITCWRPIDKSPEGNLWRLYRATILISKEDPHRISVVGRSAEWQPPQLKPIPYGDLSEAGWREGRTDRILVNIHTMLKGMAAPAPGEVPDPQDSMTPETVSDTCVMRPELIGFSTMPGMQGIPIGEVGAMGLTK